MSKTLATDRLRLGLIDWVNQTTAPDTPVGQTSGAVGSVLNRGSGSISQLWNKTGDQDDDWIVQNLWNLDIFNVVEFGAVGDGVTNDNAAVQAAIAAAKAAGGGVVYFPPRPLGYAFYKPGGANFPFDLDDHQDIVFLGDGPSSLLQQTFSGIGGDFYLFQISNLSRRIAFLNLGWTAVGDFLDEQTHFVNIRGIAADASAPEQIDFVGNWFLRCWGDVIRGLGSATRPVGATRVLYNSFNNEIGRSNIGVQRYWKKFTIAYNWLTGVDDNNIDFEPTAGADDSEVIIVGNMVDHGASGTSALTVGGDAAEPTVRATWAFNIITNDDAGGAISGISTSQAVFLGNIVAPIASGTTSPISLFRAQINILLCANICVATVDGVDSLGAISVKGDAFADSHDAIMSDNICYAERSGRALLFERVTGGQMVGNMVVVASNDDAGDAAIYRFEPIQNVSGTNLFARAIMVGNWAKTLASARQHYLIEAPLAPGTLRNLLASGNYGAGTSTSGVRVFSSSGSFSGGRACRSNLSVGVTSNNVSAPDEGLAIDGAGGTLAPGIYQSQGAMEPLGSVPAPVGSAAVYPAGSDASTLWMKGAGTGLSSGWDREGPSEVAFGALSAGVGAGAAFLSPGVVLVTPSATEIQIPITRAGVLRNLRVKQVAGVGAVTVTYRIRKNGSSAGAPSVTIAVTATQGSDLATSLVVAAGDLVSVETLKSGVAGTAPTFPVVSFELAGPH